MYIVLIRSTYFVKLLLLLLLVIFARMTQFDTMEKRYTVTRMVMETDHK